MVDFAKIKEENARKAQDIASRPTLPSDLARINHLITYHLSDLTEWETSFCYSNKTWLTAKEGNYLSDKAKRKLAEICSEIMDHNGCDLCNFELYGVRN